MAAKINKYESMFLLGPSGADADAAIGIVRTLIEKHSGQIQVIKKWDERKLAYEIGKQKRGTYIIAFFTAAGNAITALERDVTLSEEILRVLVTRADHLNEKEMNAIEPQPIAPPPERNPWDRPDMGRGGYDRPPREDRPDRGARGPRRDETADMGYGKD
jgi:small subunit ribosomal protein S6